MKGASGTAGDTGGSPVAVNVRVRVYPGMDGEVRGALVEDFGDLAVHAVDIGEKNMVGPARRWAVALDAAVWCSSTATSWPPSSIRCRGLPSVGRPSFQLRRRCRTIGCQPACRTLIALCQRSDCSILSNCLPMSVNSIVRRRNWRTTAARRCSSSARRSSRPLLCASVCMVVTPGGLAVKEQTPASVPLVC